MIEITPELVDQAASFARRSAVHAGGLPFDEAISAGYEALVDAARRFNGRGDFTGFLAQRVKFAVKNEQRDRQENSRSTHVGPVSVSPSWVSYDDIGLPGFRELVEAQLPVDDTPAASSLDLRAALTKLAPDQARRIFLRYWCDLTPTTIAQVERVTVSAISLSISRGLERLRGALA